VDEESDDSNEAPLSPQSELWSGGHSADGDRLRLFGLILPGGPISTDLPKEHPATSQGQKHFRPDPFAGRAGRYYTLVWGVGSLNVKAVESGELIRFSYEVLDPVKATPLNDKMKSNKSKP
jgi:hypothetical protein